MERYLVVDGLLHGTGVRDYYNGGYIKLTSLGISADLVNKIVGWVLRYEDEHYNGFVNIKKIDELDREGKEIAQLIKQELVEVKMEYYSAGRLRKEST